MKRFERIFRKSSLIKLLVLICFCVLTADVRAQSKPSYEMQFHLEHNYSGYVAVLGGNVSYARFIGHLGLLRNLTDAYADQAILGLSAGLHYEVVKTEKVAQYLGSRYAYQNPLEKTHMHINLLSSQTRFRLAEHWWFSLGLGYGFVREHRVLSNGSDRSSRSALSNSLNLGCVYSF